LKIYLQYLHAYVTERLILEDIISVRVEIMEKITTGSITKAEADIIWCSAQNFS
jgi:hypothetical protein